MADNVKTGIRLEAEGEQEFVKALESGSTAMDRFSTAAETAVGKVSDLDEAIAQAEQAAETQKTWEDLAGTTAQLAEGLSAQAEGVFRLANAFFDATGRAAEYGDQIDKQSQKLGISRQAYQEWNYVLGRSGTSIDSLDSSLKALWKAQRGDTKTGEWAFETLGYSMEQVAAMQPDQLFGTVIAGLQGMDDEMERSAVAQRLFGAGYTQLLPLLNSTQDETAALIARFYELGGYLDDDAVDSSAAYQDSISDINLKLENFERGLLTKFMPAMTSFREAFIDNGSLDRMEDGLGSLAEKGVNFFVYVADHGDEVITMLEAIGGAWATWKAAEVVKGIVTNVQTLYRLLGLVGQVMGVTGGAAAGGLAVGALGLATVVDHAVDVFGGTIGTLGDGHELQDYADNVAYLQEQVAAMEAIRNDKTQNMYWDFQQEDAYNMLLIQLQNAQEEYEAMQQAAQAAASEPVTDVIAQTTQASAENVESASTQMLETISESAGEIRDDFAAGVDEMSNAAAEAVQNTNDVMAANMEILAFNAEIWGEDMMMNFANGVIAGSNRWVLPAIDEVAAGVDARVGFSEPDIGPLSNFHTFAPDMMELFAKGITDSAPLVTDAVTRAFDLGAYIQPPAMGPSLNYGGVNVTFQVQEGQDGRALFEEFSFWLQNEMAKEGAVFAQ